MSDEQGTIEVGDVVSFHWEAGAFKPGPHQIVGTVTHVPSDPNGCYIVVDEHGQVFLIRNFHYMRTVK